MSDYQQKNQGFNLIEAAIVLGIVGLVIGGIWLAASSLSKSRKIETSVETLLTVMQGALGLIDARQILLLGNNRNIQSTLIAANVVPTSHTTYSPSILNVSKSPEGAVYYVRTIIRLGIPHLQINFFGPGHSTNPSTWTTFDCIEFTTKMINRASSNLAYVNYGVNYLSAPYDLNLILPVTCQTNYGSVAFGFAALQK